MIERICESDQILYITAENQYWDKATLDELRKKYNIIFMTSGDGVMPIMIIERKNSEPLVVIGSEDDGTISFIKSYNDYENSFSSYWIDSLVADLQEAKRVINKS